MIVVADSSMLITLSAINQLRLLSEMFGGVFIPQGIYDEVVILGAGKVGSEEVRNADFIHVEQVRNREAINEFVDPLSPVDAEVIALAKEKDADLILTRDRRLWRRAGQEGFVTMNPFTLFLEAKTMGFVSAVKPLLDEMRNKGIQIREGIYQETLCQAGELP